MEFHLLNSLPDVHPIVVKRRCHPIDVAPCLISFSERLSDNPSRQEILWNLICFEDEKKCLTLRDNPHFYTELPTSLEAYGDSVKIDPTEDFRHANKFYVLIDKPEPIHIMTDQDSQSFGNFWCPRNAIVFKGLGILVLFPPYSDVLPDFCGRLRGEGIVKASLKGTYCGFCKRLPQVSPVPRVSGSRHEVQPIITEGCPWIGWKSSNGWLPMHSSVEIGLGVCTGQVASETSLARCNVIL